MDAKLKMFLDAGKIKYKLHAHKKVFTAHDEAQTQHIKTKEIAKVVLVKTNKNFALVIIPAQKYVDFKKVQKALKANLPAGEAGKVSMARESDITKILKSKIGLIHPFGNLFKLPTLLDNYLAKQKQIMASAGSYTESIEIKSSDFIKLVSPVKGGFSK
jgi:Ala-tRNA(Pro) deacylase